MFREGRFGPFSESIVWSGNFLFFDGEFLLFFRFRKRRLVRRFPIRSFARNSIFVSLGRLSGYRFFLRFAFQFLAFHTFRLFSIIHFAHHLHKLTDDSLFLYHFRAGSQIAMQGKPTFRNQILKAKIIKHFRFQILIFLSQFQSMFIQFR